MTTKAIEAGARALAQTFCDHWFGVNGRGTFYKMTRDFVNGSDAWEVEAKACIEAAIASGELVPASAVAAERERCAKVAESHSFLRDIEWWLTSTKKDVSAESCLSVAAAIRSLSPEPASGEFVVHTVPPSGSEG